MKARVYLDVEFNGRKTDAESVAAAMDNVVKAGMSALGDCWDEYGGAEGRTASRAGHGAGRRTCRGVGNADRRAGG